MKPLIAALICFLLTSCSTPPSKVFESTGFNDNSVLGVSLIDRRNNQRFPLSPIERGQFFQELQKLEPARTEVVEPRFVVSLLTGSSFESQQMRVFVDESGDGYFKQGSGEPVMFYSDTLFDTLLSIESHSNSENDDDDDF